ncbi:MAG: hypothetical protein K1X94_14065 [Sandaracinaceae bacterium]|nr:hypothetical protein [Sandaracinaceae bacterium]
MIVTWRNLLGFAWHDAPRPGDLARVHRIAEELHRRHGRCGLIDLVLAGSPAFGEQVRLEGARFVDAAAGWSATAHVIELGGLAGSVVRTFLSTIVLLGRGKTAEHRVFAGGQEAARWLAQSLGGPEPARTAQEIEAAYRELRELPPVSASLAPPRSP